MEEEIKAVFTNNGFGFDEEEEILKKCLSFCINYKLSASDIVSSWDVYSLNRGLEFTVRSSHMGAFLEQLQNEQLDKIREKESGLHLYSNDVAIPFWIFRHPKSFPHRLIPPVNDSIFVNVNEPYQSRILDGEYQEVKEDMLDTPTSKLISADKKASDSTEKINRSKFSSGKPPDSVTPFGQRKSKFAVQSSLNENHSTQIVTVEELTNTEDDIIKRVRPNQKCTMHIISSQPKPGCRFMYDRIDDKFNFLENRIKKQATLYVSAGICDKPVDASIASQESIFAVGMICCEEEGRLKEKPVLLQSSVEHSGGQRVRLDLQNLNQLSVFPGQVVGVEGLNPSGHCLIVSKIIDYVPLSVDSSEDHPAKRQATDQNLQMTNLSLDEPELSLIVAAGPFTTSDNLFFEPLVELLAYARRKQPQLLVLLGPFIDSDHPELKKGYINCTFDEMFQLEILGKLQDYVEYMGSAVRVVLIPSIRDANHDFVFPQPAFDIHPADFNHQIHSTPNPGTFCANEVKVACCNVDILKHLSAEEIFRNPQGGSKHRMTNLAKHVINQCSFYPLYPPAEDVPLDYSLAREALHLSSVPDILILPSDLAHFVKVLSLDERIEGERQIKSICVNPGRLARGGGGGFFAEINYKGNPDSSSASIVRI